MRSIVILLLLIPLLGFTQLNSFKFDTQYFDAVDKWVAFPETDSTFYYGFIYLDEQAGFTYDTEGAFKIAGGKFTSVRKDTISLKVRIQPEWKLLGVIDNTRLRELGLPEVPDWLKHYKVGEEKVSYMKNMGFHFNHVGACNAALVYLTKGYDIEPHYDGLEFELAFAYNALKQFDNAILILEAAIKNNPNNFYFYRELGYAYKYLDQLDKAEETYHKGIDMSDDNFEKSEMAVNMAQTYYELKNRKKFNEWAKLTKKYAKKGSRYAEYIDYFKENWDK